MSYQSSAVVAAGTRIDTLRQAQRLIGMSAYLRLKSAALADWAWLHYLPIQ